MEIETEVKQQTKEGSLAQQANPREGTVESSSIPEGMIAVPAEVTEAIAPEVTPNIPAPFANEPPLEAMTSQHPEDSQEPVSRRYNEVDGMGPDAFWGTVDSEIVDSPIQTEHVMEKVMESNQDQDKLPNDWVKLCDPSGRIYYQNIVTFDAIQEKPSEFIPEDGEDERKETLSLEEERKVAETD